MTLLLCRWRACSVERRASPVAREGQGGWRALPVASLPSHEPVGGRGSPARPAPTTSRVQLPHPCQSAPSRDVALSPLPSTAPAFLSMSVVWSLALWLLLASELLLFVAADLSQWLEGAPRDRFLS